MFTKTRASISGFSLLELLVAMGTQTIVMAGLIAGTVALEKSFDTTDQYIRGQTAQIRLIDYVAMDLRRAHKIGIYNRPAGTYQKFAYNSQSFATVYKDQFLVITEPGFYKSQDSSSSNYRQVNPLISLAYQGSAWGVAYGRSASSVAEDTIVRYEQFYDTKYGSLCFVRRVGSFWQFATGTAPYTVIVDNSDNLYLNLTAMNDQKSFLIEAWFETNCTNNTARISSSDRVMLRNPRQD